MSSCLLNGLTYMIFATGDSWAYIQFSTGVTGKKNQLGRQGNMTNRNTWIETARRSGRAYSARKRSSSKNPVEVINQLGVLPIDGNPSNHPPPADRSLVGSTQAERLSFLVNDRGTSVPIKPKPADGGSSAAVRSFFSIQMICGQYWLVRVLS